MIHKNGHRNINIRKYKHAGISKSVTKIIPKKNVNDEVRKYIILVLIERPFSSTSN